MRNEYQRTFDQINMPEAEAAKLRGALLSKQSKKSPVIHRNFVRRPVAVLVAVILILSLSVTALAYGEKIIEHTYQFLSGGNVEVGIDEQGNPYSGTSMDPEGNFAPMELREDGRVYFTVNDENLDITEEFSYTDPYIYEYTDAEGQRHVFVVGGDLDTIGWAEFIWDKTGTPAAGKTVFGTSRGSDDAPWLTAAGKKLHLPWVF